MSKCNLNTDWVRNRSSDAIIYVTAIGIESVTLERFLADSPGNTAEMFALLKQASDDIFHDEDTASRDACENEVPLFAWSESCATPSLEDELFGKTANEHHAYIQRRGQREARLGDMQTPDSERETIFENQFTSFMVAVVRNARNGYMRKATRIKRRETLLSEIPEHLHPWTNDYECGSRIPSYTDFWENLANPQVYHAVKSLTDRQKQVLYLSFAHDMTNKQIAAYLKCSPRNVQRTIKISIARITTQLEAQKWI